MRIVKYMSVREYECVCVCMCGVCVWALTGSVVRGSSPSAGLSVCLPRARWSCDRDPCHVLCAAWNCSPDTWTTGSSTDQRSDWLPPASGGPHIQSAHRIRAAPLGLFAGHFCKAIRQKQSHRREICRRLAQEVRGHFSSTIESV